MSQGVAVGDSGVVVGDDGVRVDDDTQTCCCETQTCTCPGVPPLASAYTITGTAQIYSGPNGTGSLVHTINANFAAAATLNPCEWSGDNGDALVYGQIDGSSPPCPWHIWLTGLYAPPPVPYVSFYDLHVYKASGATPVGNYGDSAWYNDTYWGGGSIKFFGVQVQ